MTTFPKDPATAYARAVLAGTEIASRSVVLACQRHLDDLTHATNRGLVWDKQAAIRVCQFSRMRLAERALTTDRGKPFVLAGWRKLSSGSLCGGNGGGHQRRIAYLESARAQEKRRWRQAARLSAVDWSASSRRNAWRWRSIRRLALKIPRDGLRLSRTRAR